MSRAKTGQPDFNIGRLPKDLQAQFRRLYGGDGNGSASVYLKPNTIYCGDARDLLPLIESNSIALSVWSPPYFVGKEYEAHLTFDDWQSLLATVIKLHFPIVDGVPTTGR